jgi:integrase
MSKKRDYGSGALEARGPNSWRLRYRIGGKVFRKTVRGSKSEAQKIMRGLLHAGDTGQHVDPSRMTLQQWVTHWLSIGAPGGKNRRPIGQRALERYEALLRVHVLPVLGDRPLQQIEASEIDALYAGLDERLSAGSRRFVHLVLASRLGTAARTRKLSRNPMLDITLAGRSRSWHVSQCRPAAIVAAGLQTIIAVPDRCHSRIRWRAAQRNPGAAMERS